MIPKKVTQHIMLKVNGKPVDHHYYTRYIKPKTELWCFTVGLGEQSIMNQLGETFLKAEDPALGRVMLALGASAIAEKPFKGDFNVWWAFDAAEDFIPRYLERATVKPDLALACSKRLFNVLTDADLDTIMCPPAASERFHPLHLHREGLGYVGGDNKSPEQKRLMLEPFLRRSDFEWHGRKASDEWYTEEKLNDWYNRKQIVFGLQSNGATYWHEVGNRLFETYASGTPIIFPRHPGFEETFGFKQPYPVDDVGDVERWVFLMQKDYPKTLKTFEALSAIVRAQHSYVSRLGKLIGRLKEMRK